MAREVWFQLVSGKGVAVTTVEVPNNATVACFRKAVLGVVSNVLPVESNLTVYTSNTSRKLEENYPISSLGESKKDALFVIVEVPQQQTIKVGPADRQTQDLLNILEWKEPSRLCRSSGDHWTFQGASEIATDLAGPLLQHYQAWQDGNQDKQNHALDVVVGGPGTGKSRTIDEMKNLLCKAAEQSENQDLVKRMTNAYVFSLAFGGRTGTTGKLIDSHSPEVDICFRMLYQLLKENESWMEFVFRLMKSSSSICLSICAVIRMLAKLEQIDNVRDMTVVLCVEGIHKLENDGTYGCDFYRVLSCVIMFLNSSTAFAVCVSSTTAQEPFTQAFMQFQQKRVFLYPPSLNGHEILRPRSRIGKQLVDDMGGHGRALETLERVLSCHKDSLQDIDPGGIVKQVYAALLCQYGEIFASPQFTDPMACQDVLIAIFSGHRFNGVYERIGRSNLTVDELRNIGLFRQTQDGRLECAVIMIVALMRRLLRHLNGGYDIDGFLPSVWGQHRFDQFVAFYRRVKSIIYCDLPVSLAMAHRGARFGSIDGIVVKEPKAHLGLFQQSQNSDSKYIRDVCDLSTRVQLTIDGREVQCNEVIRCKAQETKQRVNEVTYAKERAEAVNESSDVFFAHYAG
ncbi:crinkler (CRN) domain-containing protein [Phytophthora infestans T30-4]|uniref:Crinkler (CRN) domain-containing protein n=1 Tax=Phytophthora infestans (strain T30-4) TaxID=403677 RepID=D0NM37_PHYIT|nr:crinkler (CRN) domain-containing protein [Phytophthora infestans T30-4]EEY60758.1 crinkler (CRN) domain-containing protein [Phytophthora infestans T30-4]|eukprot:XP_002899704.1 crinkler (CRN) domain-containing protein [Phytophthora infestans T30-4]